MYTMPAKRKHTKSQNAKRKCTDKRQQCADPSHCHCNIHYENNGVKCKRLACESNGRITRDKSMETSVCSEKRATGSRSNADETHEEGACIDLESFSSHETYSVTSKYLGQASKKCTVTKLALSNTDRNTRKTSACSVEEATGSESSVGETNFNEAGACSSLEYASANEQNLVISKYSGRLRCRLNKPICGSKVSITSQKSKKPAVCSGEEARSCGSNSAGEPSEEETYSGLESASSKEKSSNKYPKRVSLKCQGDTNQYGCWIWGLVAISDNKLIVTDYNNMAVKMVDIKKDEVMACMIMRTNPLGLTIIDKDIIAVTVPDELKIKLIKISEHSLVFKEDITTFDKCYGIIFHCYTLIVSCIAPRRIQTLNMEGLVLRSFETFSENQPIIVQPAFIALSLDKQSLYMTDSHNCSITQFSLDGKQLTEYAHYDLRGASGIAVDKNGWVFVATWSGSEPEKGRVYKFNEDLSEPKIFLGKDDGVLYPCPIYLNKETNMLYLSNSYLVNDYVSIYQIGEL